MEIETVKVTSPASDENPLGYIIINKGDLTPEHELFVEAGAEPTKRGPGRPRKEPE